MPATAQQNLGFEADAASPSGWNVGLADNGAARVEIAIDASVAATGARSLRVVQDRDDGYVRVVQSIAPGATATREPRRVRVSALVREPAAQQAEAAIWIRLAGEKGPLFLDSRGEGRERRATEPAFGTAGAAESGVDDWTRREVELPLPDDVDEIAFGASLRGRGSAWFDDFTVAIVAADGPPATRAALEYVDAALDLIRRHSINREAVDWGRVRAAALAQARGAREAADTYPALRHALRELGDRHSYLLAPRPAARLLAAPVSNARTGRAAVAPRAELAAGGLGYVAVPGFAGGTPADQVRFAETLQSSIETIDRSMACGWILDLRLNTGGNLWPMLAGLGPLLGTGELAASVYPDGSRRAIWYDDGRAGFGDYVQLRVPEPYALRDAHAPLAVLIGARTASSAEVLVAALRGRPHSRTFGAPTRGLSAGNRTFALADGAALVLTVAATSDRAGRVEVGPIEPDQRVGADGPATSEPDAVRAAASEWLRAQPACHASPH